MQIEYDLTVDDYIRFNEYHLGNSLTVRRIRQRSVAAGPVIYMAIGVALSVKDRHPFSLVLTAIVSIVYAWAFPIYWRRTMRSRMRKFLAEGARAGGSEHGTLSIDEEGIHDTGPNGSSTTKWHAVTKVVDTDTDLYIYVSNVKAFIIPRRLFEDRGHLERFTREVRQFREASAGLPAME